MIQQTCLDGTDLKSSPPVIEWSWSISQSPDKDSEFPARDASLSQTPDDVTDHLMGNCDNLREQNLRKNKSEAAAITDNLALK